MQFTWLGGAFVKNRISLVCITALGATIGAGLINIEVNGNKLSHFLANISNLFKAQTTQAKSSIQPWNPITTITEISFWLWTNVLSSAVQFVSSGYEWVKENENQAILISFLKNFWNYEFLTQIIFNLPWTIWAWINIFKERTMLNKFPLAFKRSKTLSLAILAKGKEDQELLQMINWLYLRLLVNPRKTLNILSRANISKQLMCESPPQPPQEKAKKWLGNCFFEKNGGKSGFKLKQEIQEFLKTGQNLKDKAKSQN